MSRKKILVCGSLGYLMANFIRYLMYRSKDYEIISVDRISSNRDVKRIYYNQNHIFHVGNISDSNFIGELYTLVQPDIILNGTESNEPNSIVMGAYNLTQTNTPVVQICPSLTDMDKNGWWNSVAEMVKNNNGVVIEVPNCFGTRQRENNDFARLVYLIGKTFNTELRFSKKIFPWAYAEDVCSLLWFIIESMLSDKYIEPHIQMTLIGQMSIHEMASGIASIINSKLNIQVADKPSVLSEIPFELCENFQGSVIPNWQPEGLSIEEALEKTSLWYKSNKWALCL